MASSGRCWVSCVAKYQESKHCTRAWLTDLFKLFHWKTTQEPEGPPPPSSSPQIPRKSGWCGVHLAHEGCVSFCSPVKSNYIKKRPSGYLLALHWYLMFLILFFSFNPSHYPPFPFFINALNNVHYHEIWKKDSPEKRESSNKMRNMFILIISQKHVGQGLSPVKSTIMYSLSVNPAS